MDCCPHPTINGIFIPSLSRAFRIEDTSKTRSEASMWTASPFEPRITRPATPDLADRRACWMIVGMSRE